MRVEGQGGSGNGVHAKSLQPCPTLCDSMDRSLPGSSVHEDSPGKNPGVGFHALLQGNLPNPEIEPRFPALQVDSCDSEGCFCFNAVYQLYDLGLIT